MLVDGLMLWNGGLPEGAVAAVGREEIVSANTRLAVYGSLAPGECTHHVIAHLRGVWSAGVVRGILTIVTIRVPTPEQPR